MAAIMIGPFEYWTSKSPEFECPVFESPLFTTCAIDPSTRDDP